jgi:hypothetical protein
MMKSESAKAMCEREHRQNQANHCSKRLFIPHLAPRVHRPLPPQLFFPRLDLFRNFPVALPLRLALRVRLALVIVRAPLSFGCVAINAASGAGPLDGLEPLLRRVLRRVWEKVTPLRLARVVIWLFPLRLWNRLTHDLA